MLIFLSVSHKKLKNVYSKNTSTSETTQVQLLEIHTTKMIAVLFTMCAISSTEKSAPFKKHHTCKSRYGV